MLHSSSGAAGSDAAACEGYGDVLTITANADIALREGRIAQQEHDGWYRLATRVLYRVPHGESDAVRDAIAALRDSARPVASGAGYSTGIGSDAWNEADSLLGAACEDSGTGLAIEAFTGG
ncbi:hypothetical protein [Agrococcus sp. DT81.2]|uniref:hypothetical protein n=1 Tax=Agrococcus sp. DT81.2 TaxID=3393414 RepID=UPI003CE55E96